MFAFTTVHTCVCNIIRNISFLAFAVILEISYALYKMIKHNDYNIEIPSKKYHSKSQPIRYARDRSPMSIKSMRR